MGRILSLFAGLLILFWGRSILLSETAAPAVAMRDGLLVVVLGMALFAVNSRMTALAAPSREDAPRNDRLPLPGWIGLAVAGAGGGWLAFGMNTGSERLLPALLLWAAGLLFTGAWLFWPRRAARPPVRSPVWSVESARLFLAQRREQSAPGQGNPLALSPRTVVILLGAMLLLGLILRLWNVGGLPSGCLPEECRAVTAALDFLEAGSFSQLLAGDSPSFTLLLSLFLSLFGVSVTSTTALGLLLFVATLPLFYLALTRFVSPIQALLTILLLVFAPLQLVLSRHPSPVLLLIFLIVAFLAARPEPDTSPRPASRWVLAALAMGLALLSAAPPTAWMLLLWAVLVPPRQPAHRLPYYAALLVGALPGLARSFPSDALAGLSLADTFEHATMMAAHFVEEGGYLPAILALAGGAALLRHLRTAPGWLWTTGVVIAGLTVFATDPPVSLHGVAPLLVLLGIGAAVAIDQVTAPLLRGWSQVIRPLNLAGAVGALLALVLFVGGVSRLEQFAGQLRSGDGGQDAAIGAYLFERFGGNVEAEEGVETLVLVPGNVLLSPSAILAARGVLPSPRIVPLDPVAHLPFTGPPFVEQGMADLLYIVPETESDLGRALDKLYPGTLLELLADDDGRVWAGVYQVSRASAANSQGLPTLYFAGDEAPTAENVTPQTISDTRRDGPLDFDWQNGSPLPLPFALRGEGALYIPAAGTHSLRLVAAGTTTARLTLTSPLGVALELDTSDGRLEGSAGLPQGFAALEFVAASGSQGGSLDVQWQRPNGPWESIPRQALYGPEAVSDTGLLARYYAPSGQGPLALDPESLATAPLVDWRVEPWLPLGPRVLPGGAVQWQGKVAAPVEGGYNFFVDADGPHRLEIDGLTLINSATEGVNDTSLLLTEGWHDFTLAYQPGAEGRLQFLWQPPQSGAVARIPGPFLAPLPPSVAATDLALPRLAETAPRPVQSFDGPRPQPAIAAGPPAPTGALAVDDLPLLPFALAWQTGSCGSDFEQFLLPRGVAINRLNELVYVADQGNRRVVLRGLSDGGLVDFYGDESFEEPFDLDVDLLGRVFVLDAVAQSIYRFEEPQGLAVPQPSRTAFYRPRGMAMDLNGNFYVADTGGARIVRLNGQDGAVELQEGGPDTALGQGQPVDVLVLPSGALYAVTAQDGVLWRLDTSESWQVLRPANTFDGPHFAGLTTGRFFVSDPEGRQILYFGANGRPLGMLQDDLFAKPVGVSALILEGEVLLAVTDSLSCRLSLWRAPLEAMPAE